MNRQVMPSNTSSQKYSESTSISSNNQKTSKKFIMNIDRTPVRPQQQVDRPNQNLQMQDLLNRIQQKQEQSLGTFKQKQSQQQPKDTNQQISKSMIQSNQQLNISEINMNNEQSFKLQKGSELLYRLNKNILQTQVKSQASPTKPIQNRISQQPPFSRSSNQNQSKSIKSTLKSNEDYDEYGDELVEPYGDLSKISSIQQNSPQRKIALYQQKKQNYFQEAEDDNDDDDQDNDLIDATLMESEEDEKESESLLSNKQRSVSSPQKKTANPNSQYSIQRVVGEMLLKKDRKIPQSVFKPHSDEIYIIISSHLNQVDPLRRIFFPYPQYCMRNNTAPSFLSTEYPLLQSKTSQVLKMSQQEMEEQYMTLGFKMTESTHIYNAAVNSMKSAGFRIISPNSSKWNIMWTGVTKPEYLKEANQYQRINHFTQSFHLGRKDLMWKNVQRLMLQYPKDYNICPITYLLPEDYKNLQIDRDLDKKGLYIMKPNAASCGKGIKVVGPGDIIPRKGGHLLSKYIMNPHLIDGLKYDLRIYVLVTSYDPLKVYLFKEGLVRFATEKYTNNIQSLKKRFVHLTNYSVNKKAEGYVKNQDKVGGDQSDEEEQKSSKWNLLQLKKHFDKEGIDYYKVKERIKDVIIKTLISVEPQIVNTMSRSTKHKDVCFEIYGFDILLDHKLKPWLLEVNISPSLSSSSPLDKKIKTMLICDSLNLVGVQPYDRRQYQEQLEQNLKKKLLGLDKNDHHQSSTQKGKGKRNEFNKQVSISKLVKMIDDKQAIINVDQDDVNIIVGFEEEQMRRGNFDLIFPLPLNISYYSQFFEYERQTNSVLWRYIQTLYQQRQKI